MLTIEEQNYVWKKVKPGVYKTVLKNIIVVLLIIIISYLLRHNKKAMIIFILLSLSLLLLLFNWRVLEDKQKFNDKMDKYGHFFTPNSIIFANKNYFNNVWDETSINISKQILRGVDTVCNKFYIPYSLAYGTLLGWARHSENPIPWDDDMDIVIDKKYIDIFIKAVENTPDLYIAQNNKYFYKIYHSKGIPIYKHSDKITWPFVDVFMYEKNDNDGIKIKNEYGKWDIHNIPLSFKRTEFLNIPTMVFSDYITVLNDEYGPDWKDVCVSSNWNHRFEFGISSIKKSKCQLLT